jgi:polysaccharide biosynthesis transport protein
VEIDQDHNAEEQLLNFDFRRYFEGLRKYVWVVLAIMALTITGSVIYTQRQPRIYQATASIQIEPRLPDILGQRQDLLSRASVGGTDYYAQQQEVLSSYQLARQTVEAHRLYTKLLTEEERGDRKIESLIEQTTHRVRSMISVRYPSQNRIMYVVVHSEDPQLAADIANAHVSTYVDYAKGLVSTDTKRASGALSTEFDDAEAKLRAAESALYAFQKENDLLAVSIEEKQTLVSSEITAYSTRLNEARAKKIELTSLLDRMRKAAQGEVLSSPILMLGTNGTSNSFDSLRAQYYTERNKFIEMEKELGPKHIQHQMQKARIDDLYQALQTEAKRMLAGIEEQVAAITTTEAALKREADRATKEALALGPKIVAYNELLRRKKSQEDRYNILRTRLSTSELSDRMSQNFDSSNVRPLDPALVPGSPVSPRLRTNVAVAVVLSLALAFGIVFLLIFFDRSIRTTGDAQQATGVPVLGIVPILEEFTTGDADDRARDLYVHEQPTSRIAECCRSIRTNILFSAADRQIKTIVVSSANPREGKTTCVIYLGTTMAQSGMKVLLIDTDMRRPRLHSSLGVSRQTGLSNLIVGDQDYDSVIRTTDIPNLFVLPCGPLPPNPAELLMSHRFETVLAELAKRFDRIILDSPPLQVVTDAVVLSKQADGAILVVHANKTLRDEIKRSARQIKNVEGTIFGVIVNAIEPDQRSGYYYSYYGYTEKSPEPQTQASG